MLFQIYLTLLSFSEGLGSIDRDGRGGVIVATQLALAPLIKMYHERGMFLSLNKIVCYLLSCLSKKIKE